MDRAWFVTTRDDPSGWEWAEVVKAPTRGQAIVRSEMYRMEDFAFTDLRAVRLPGMDGKAHTDENLYTYGRLMVRCRLCNELAEGKDGGDPFFNDQGRAYCWRHRPVAKEQL